MLKSSMEMYVCLLAFEMDDIIIMFCLGIFWEAICFIVDPYYQLSSTSILDYIIHMNVAM